jgi:hypothetical protein
MKIYGGMKKKFHPKCIIILIKKIGSKVYEQKILIQRYNSNFFTYKMGHNSLMMK